jgi:hypothetical protein
MIERGGFGHPDVEGCSAGNVQPIIQHCIKPGSQTYTDENEIYGRME